MERGEPTFVPEWYKSSSSSTSSNSSSNHHTSSSSHLDEHGVAHSSRNRLSVSASERDAPRSSVFVDRSLSSRRSGSSNGSMSHDKDSSLHLRPYGSFGRSHRERDWEKDINLRDRDRSYAVDNGFCDYSDSFVGGRSEKDTLRHSHSLASGKRVESLPKRLGNDLKNGILSGVSIIGGIGKTSFERDFPSLGADEKPGHPEIGRVSSPGLSSAIQNLPKGIGSDCWTSALVDSPVVVGGNGPVPSSASLGSTASSSSTGLNMAETLAQAPSRVRTPPQLSINTQRIEERTRIQYSKLIPVTPSMPKSLALNSSEKSKAKGTRSGDLSGPSKVGQQPSQLVNLTLRSSARTDSPKVPPQGGNFHVLNRERNGISPTAKDTPILINASRAVTPHGGVQVAAIHPPKSAFNPKLKADNKAGAPSQSSFGEKRPTSQAQNRNDFFNFIRKKTPMSPSADLTEPSCGALSSCSGKLGEQITGTSTSVNQENVSPASCSDLEYPVENGNGMTEESSDVSEAPSRSVPDNEDGGSSSDPVVPDSSPGNVSESSSGLVLAPASAPGCVEETLDVVPSEEELDLLRRLGWDENAEGDALTPEEINDFVSRYEGRTTSLKVGQRDMPPLRMVRPDSGQSGVAGDRFN